MGDEWRKVNQAIAEVDRIAVEAVHADSSFETGKPNATRAVNIALRGSFAQRSIVPC